MRGRVFIYGKVPSRGDFVSRGLPPSDRMAWDGWCRTLADSLSAHIEIGEGEREQTFPVLAAPEGGWTRWHCALAVPSRDSVGRLFPFVAGVSTEERPQAAEIEALLRVLESKIRWALRPDVAPHQFVDCLTEDLSAFRSSTPALGLH